MTNILIPTDFTPASLKMAEALLKKEDLQKCNLVLFHAFEQPTSPQELWIKSFRDPSAELMTEAFRQACKSLKDQYTAQIGKIVVRCMKGSTPALFRNFIEANDIDIIFCPEGYTLTPPHVRSVDPLILFRQCGVPVMKTAERRRESVVQSILYPSMQVSTQ
jgi:hypothetical protein